MNIYLCDVNMSMVIYITFIVKRFKWIFLLNICKRKYLLFLDLIDALSKNKEAKFNISKNLF